MHTNILLAKGIEQLALKALPDGHRDQNKVESCVSEMPKEYGRRWAGWAEKIKIQPKNFTYMGATNADCGCRRNVSCWRP